MTAFQCSSLFLVVVFLLVAFYSNAGCENQCSGHGKCLSGSKCSCYEGWGAESDVTDYRAPDCSAKTCPAGYSWGLYFDVLHGYYHQKLVECSGRGLCNRDLGECECFSGYGGPACQRSKCFNDCSGHGYCVPLKVMAKKRNAMPISSNISYGLNLTAISWDRDMIYGCVCDSSWRVGLGYGESQTPEYFGPDCSLRHCPSGNDPITTKNETDCYNVTDSSGRGVGEYGNLCHVDCSNRGICDYETGSCKCFSGFAGPNCGYYSTVMRDGSIDESDPAILKASVYRSAEQTGYHWINPV